VHVGFINTVNGRSKKERKEAYYELRSSGYITKLKQSIFAPFDIHAYISINISANP
jgi:hypothetical protein